MVKNEGIYKAFLVFFLPLSILLKVLSNFTQRTEYFYSIL